MLVISINNNLLNYPVLSGAVATLIHDAVSNPTEVIKQRMQMYNSSYKSVIACMKGVYKNEGIKAFYRSYSTQLVMNIPHQTIHFATYEFFQNMVYKIFYIHMYIWGKKRNATQVDLRKIKITHNFPKRTKIKINFIQN